MPNTFGAVYAWYNWDTFNTTTNKWEDYYNVNSNGINTGSPIKNTANKYIEFTNNISYQFIGNNSLPDRGVYFIRARKNNNTAGRIINGCGFHKFDNNQSNWLNHLLGWHDTGIGWAYLTQGNAITPIPVPNIQCGNNTNGISQTSWNIFVFRASDIGTQHCWIYNNGALYSINDIMPPTDNNQWQYTVPAYYCINTSLVFPEPSFCQISDFLIYQSYMDISDADVAQICASMAAQYA
jgi:hypothetical protein